MIAHSEWKGGSIFETRTENGTTVSFNIEPPYAQGPSPMEMVLMALCGCTSATVVSILRKKRQPLESLTVTATAARDETPPHVFSEIKLTCAVAGELDRKAVEDAVALTKNKYCPVSKMLEKTAEIGYEIVFEGGETEP
jgi:putative redox protein